MTEVEQPTLEGIELEKKLRDNPHNKVEGRIVVGNLISSQSIRRDAAKPANTLDTIMFYG